MRPSAKAAISGLLALAAAVGLAGRAEARVFVSFGFPAAFAPPPVYLPPPPPPPPPPIYAVPPVVYVPPAPVYVRPAIRHHHRRHHRRATHRRAGCRCR